MPAPTITALPPAPLRSQTPAVFTATAETFVEALEDLPTEINAFGAYLDDLGLDPADIPAEATASEVWTGTAADKFISPNTMFDAAAVVTLTDAATIAVDMATGINFSVTLTDNRTLGNPTNAKVGQSGSIYVVQDAGGTNTLALASDWKPIGGAPTIDTTGNAVNVFAYFVRATGAITVSYLGVEG